MGPQQKHLYSRRIEPISDDGGAAAKRPFDGCATPVAGLSFLCCTTALEPKGLCDSFGNHQAPWSRLVIPRQDPPLVA